jgi:hypothetical protein
MDMQPGVCVIDLFGMSYDGTLPSIVFACDEIWFGLFAVAPPNPPDLESAVVPRGGIVSLFESRERVLRCFG